MVLGWGDVVMGPKPSLENPHLTVLGPFSGTKPLCSEGLLGARREGVL